MELNLSNIDIVMTFDPEDLAVIQRTGAAIPPLWTGHPMQPAAGDVVRFGAWQCSVFGRAWEHNGTRPVLRLYMSRLTARSDETLH